jgi:hypothetical protein
MNTYHIKHWTRFQHFRNRRPPWIKLYREILEDVEFHDLSGSDAKALVLLWLIASERNGALPDARALAFRLRIREDDVTALLSRLSHWVYQDDINLISKRYQHDTPEREGEREKETENNTHSHTPDGDVRTAPDGALVSSPSDQSKDQQEHTAGTPEHPEATPTPDRPPKRSKPPPIPAWLAESPGYTPDLWAAWMDTRRRKRATTSGHAIGLLLAKLQKRPSDAVAAIQLAVERGWQGFEWAWFDDARARATGGAAAGHAANGAGGQPRKLTPNELRMKIDAALNWLESLPQYDSDRTDAQRQEARETSARIKAWRTELRQ